MTFTASVTGFKQQGARRDTVAGRGRNRDLKCCKLSLELNYHGYCSTRWLGIIKHVKNEVLLFCCAKSNTVVIQRSILKRSQ